MSTTPYSKLKWRCRRGMKELDVLLGRYLEQHYPNDSAEEQERFESFLEWQDTALFDSLVKMEDPEDPAFLPLVEKIRALI